MPAKAGISQSADSSRPRRDSMVRVVLLKTLVSRIVDLSVLLLQMRGFGLGLSLPGGIGGLASFALAALEVVICLACRDGYSGFGLESGGSADEMPRWLA